ncbi:hypothetical protein VTL71DRAFT_5921 [Oculimacula yallundae]|uniref:Uncharacterized protein n=1 Tax=Oculimacula yallundae TaxID=86028 RepID=A0ABR4BYV6_9HELO
MFLVGSRSSSTEETSVLPPISSSLGCEQSHRVPNPMISKSLPRFSKTGLSWEDMQHAQSNQVTAKDLSTTSSSVDINLHSTETSLDESLTSDAVSSDMIESAITTSSDIVVNPCSELDPYGEPQPLPNCKTRVFVYPHSSSLISEDHLRRFPTIINIFKRNMEKSSDPKLHTHETDFTLRMCGPSPKESQPSIIVFCTKAVFPNLRSLFASKRIANQCHPGSSHYTRRWGSMLRKPAEDPGDSQMPRFNIYYWWATKMPRVLHWGTVEDIRVDQPYDDSLAQLEVLTMCGSRIAATDGRRLATLGCLVRVQSKLYGLSASHAFQRMAKSDAPTPEMPADSHQSEDLFSDLLSCGSMEDEIDLTDDVDDCCIVDDVEYDLDATESSGNSSEPSGSVTPADQDSLQELPVNVMSGVIIYPSDELDDSKKADLDWALIEVTERQY